LLLLLLLSPSLSLSACLLLVRRRAALRCCARVCAVCWPCCVGHVSCSSVNLQLHWVCRESDGCVCGGCVWLRLLCCGAVAVASLSAVLGCGGAQREKSRRWKQVRGEPMTVDSGASSRTRAEGLDRRGMCWTRPGSGSLKKRLKKLTLEW